MKNAEILGKKVLPLVRRGQIGAEYASTVLHGVNDMHRACHMTLEQTSKMVDRACEVLRAENREQTWRVSGIYDNGKFKLTSDLGYAQDNVSRSDFRILKKKL